MPFTGGSSTYYSTISRPTTVTLVDTRTEEAIFSIEIPVGKQLSLDFVEGKGDDPVETPDLMRYQLFEIGTTSGKLRNAMTVPAATARRIDVDYRHGAEPMSIPARQALRTDQLPERPAWWTPRGGPLPQDAAMTMYDD